MKFLALEKEIEGVADDQFKPLLKEEALKIWELYTKEKIREIYFTEDNAAVLILECNTKEEVEKILNSLPLVKNKLIAFTIINLKPYPGFERLFS